jgi:hypothetical protein
MKKLSVALLFCLISSIAHAQEIIELTKPMKCSNAEHVVRHFSDVYNEKPLWVGKTTNGTHVTLMVNKDKGTWTMVEYDSAIACVLGAGETSSKPEI